MGTNMQDDKLGLEYIIDRLNKRLAELDGGRLTSGSWHLRAWLDSYVVCEYMRVTGSDNDTAIQICSPEIESIIRETNSGMTNSELVQLVEKHVKKMFPGQ
jgi:hypothetical protein